MNKTQSFIFAEQNPYRPTAAKCAKVRKGKTEFSTNSPMANWWKIFVPTSCPLANLAANSSTLVFIPVAALLFLTPLYLWANGQVAPLDSLFAEPELQQIIQGKDLGVVYTKSQNLQNLYLPPHIACCRFDYLTILKGKIKSKASLLDFANLLLSVSKMAGMQYYSVTQVRWQTYIISSYTIAAKDRPEPVPDPVIKEIGNDVKIYYVEQDNRSGKVIYEGRITFSNDSTMVYILKNATPVVRFLLFKAKPNDMCRYIHIIKVEDGFLFYVAVRAKIPTLLPRKPTAKQSFLNRAKAFVEFYRRNLAPEAK